MDYRLVCPNCHKQGTVKSNAGIPDGAKLHCAGCGHTYSYRGAITAARSKPLAQNASISSLIPITPQAKPKQPTRTLTRSSLIGYCGPCPAGSPLPAGQIQFAILIGGTVLGIFGGHISGMDRYRAEAAALIHRKQAGQGQMAELTRQMQQNTNQMQQLANQMQQLHQWWY